MTYHIRSGRGSDGRIDLGRIGDVIASYRPDLVALREVDGPPRRCAGGGAR
jgi:endonuclease/exonuclease/phosphatase family metal-dependent hydrolase